MKVFTTYPTTYHISGGKKGIAFVFTTQITFPLVQNQQQSTHGHNPYPLQQQQKGGGSVKTPPPPPKQGDTAGIAKASTQSGTRNTGRRSTILTGGQMSLEDRIKNLLGG